MEEKGRPQLELFGTAPAPSAEPRSSPEAERLERDHAEAAAIAASLPEGVFFGTSSWSFPEWAGIVYSRRATPAELAREGLAEYARHPLLTAVGIDRSYYAPIPREDLLRYARQLPPGFPCCAKAPEAVTSAARTTRAGPASGKPNPDFFNPRIFLDELVLPFREVFRGHAGPFLLQCPPAPRGVRLPPEVFAEKLDQFLGSLPKDFRYAVELRDPALLTRGYAAVLAARGAAHVCNYSTAMPMPEEQAKTAPVAAAPFAVIRLLLPPGSRYGERREALAPFARLSAPDEEMRRQVVSLVRMACDARIPVYVLVNNKAEGCAPLTIRALAERLAQELHRPR